MSSPSAVADLLSALAYRLKNRNQEFEDEPDESSLSMGLAVSKLNRTLTLDNGGEESPVLDAAISLMCFKAPQVFDSAIEYLVRTIVSVLSASMKCKVLRYQNEETLQFGSSNLPQCSEELIDISKDIIDKLGANGKLAKLLFQAVVRSAASRSWHRKSGDGSNRAVSKLLAYLPRESSVENREIPLRIMFWYQDPLSLKEDVSRILKDVTERPFLSLKKELFENEEWRDIVICLTLSPSMFINTRALLHKWFLLTGLASVFELLSGLVSAIMETISRPSYWGIPLELASMLPFSDAYFPFRCQFLRILAGPLTSKSLVMLAHTISKPADDVTKKPRLDDKSEWALAINFPDWFYFASAMLFSKGNPLQQACNDVEGVSIVAATYIAWILNPVSSRTVQESLSRSLSRVSEICTRKSSYSETITGKRKKPDRGKASSNVEEMVRTFHNEVAESVFYESDSSSQKTRPSGFKNNLLIRRVVVGVLIGSPSSVTDDEYELVLHYAATGKILAVKKSRIIGFKQAKNSSLNEITKEEAIEGTRLVFNLTETLESLSVSSFEAEEDAQEFVNRFKVKSSKYLVKCIDRLIQLHCEEDGDLILNDLNNRLLQWTTIQGREESQFNKDLDIIAARLACVLLPL